MCRLCMEMSVRERKGQERARQAIRKGKVITLWCCTYCVRVVVDESATVSCGNGRIVIPLLFAAANQHRGMVD